MYASLSVLILEPPASQWVRASIDGITRSLATETNPLCAKRCLLDRPEHDHPSVDAGLHDASGIRVAAARLNRPGKADS